MRDWILINNSKNSKWPRKKEWRIFKKLLPRKEQQSAELKESVLQLRRKYITNTIIQYLGTDYGRSKLLEFYKDQGIEFFPLYHILESETDLPAIRKKYLELSKTNEYFNKVAHKIRQILSFPKAGVNLAGDFKTIVSEDIHMYIRLHAWLLSKEGFGWITKLYKEVDYLHSI